SADGVWLAILSAAAGETAARLFFWHLPSRELLHRHEIPGLHPGDGGFSRDGLRFALSRDQGVEVWDVRTGTVLGTLRQAPGVNAYTSCHLGARFLLATGVGRLAAWPDSPAAAFVEVWDQAAGEASGQALALVKQYPELDPPWSAERFEAFL